MTLKEEIRKAFPDMPAANFDRYCSDMYVLYSDELNQWLKKNYRFYTNIKICVSNVKGNNWYGKRFFDIPFAAMEEDIKAFRELVRKPIINKQN